MNYQNSSRKKKTQDIFLNDILYHEKFKRLHPTVCIPHSENDSRDLGGRDEMKEV